jgi:hypothetical protein
MDMPAEELTDAEIENLFAKGVVKADTKWSLWHIGAAVVIGFLAALLLGLSGVLEPDSAQDGHLAEALRLSTTAPQR